MLWIFLLQLISTLSAEHETLCTSDACFTLHMDKVSFEKARHNCGENGGYLMTVRDGAEEEVLRSLLTKIQRKRPDRTLRFWIGLKLHRGDCGAAQKPLRGFKWVSGEEDSQYANWEKEPVTSCTGERCVKAHYSGQNQLKWTDETCKKPAFYACKFYFKGMCKPLALLGPGEITYTVPFSKDPEKSEMQSFPFGTYASVLCAGDQDPDYSVCTPMDDTYRWNHPGPFCKTGKQSCAVNNGGCEHLCHQEADEVRCFCKEGYDLGEDGITCRMTDLCGVDTCEHQCVTRESGYFCKCPDGFRLEQNQRNCSDVDECQLHACGSQLCLNTPGSYTCACKDGYEMVDGVCSDVDECERGRCTNGCSNSVGSFSCFCDEGFTLSPDGHTCEDVDECVGYPCHDKCINTAGSFLCTCPQGFHLESDGSTCAPDLTGTSVDSSEEPAAASSDEPREEETPENVTESLTGTTVELQHPSPHTDAPLSDLVNVTSGDRRSNSSFVAGAAQSVNSRVMICVLGSVVPLLLLIAVTLAIAIVRCNRSKKEAKKSSTADGYCWVSSGLDPRLEKLYESILTDDL